jgi:hypothetical protein
MGFDGGCVLVRPTGLKVGKVYTLVLSRGSTYHSRSGPAKQDMEVSISGLEPFKMPFREFQFYEGRRWRRQNVWLRHGLKSEAMLPKLAASITIHRITGTPTAEFNGFVPTGGKVAEALPFTVKLVDPGTLQLEAAFSPQQHYRLTVSPSNLVLDGFDLPLEGSVSNFIMSPAGDVYLSPKTAAVFQDLVGSDDDEAGDWIILSRGKNVFCRYNAYNSGGCAYDPVRSSAALVTPKTLASALGGYFDYSRSAFDTNFRSTSSVVASGSDDVELLSLWEASDTFHGTCLTYSAHNSS